MKYALLFIAALLGGCASQPAELVLQPITPTTSAQATNKVAVALTSSDLRTETYLGRIRQAGEPAELLSATVNPRQLLEEGLRRGLSQQGYSLSADSQVSIALELNKLVVDVEQDTLEHQGSSEAAVTLVLDNQKQQLTKRFKAKGSFKGVMKADAAQMEAQLNQRVQQLIDAVLADAEIQQFIQGSY